MTATPMATAYTLAFLLASIVGVLGCSLTPSEDDNPRVTVSQTPDKLTVTNYTRETIWTFVVGQGTLATILWAPTLDEEGIAPGTSKQVAKADIAKAPDEKDVIVFWWQAVNKDGERVPGDMQSIAVSLGE